MKRIWHKFFGRSPVYAVTQPSPTGANSADITELRDGEGGVRTGGAKTVARDKVACLRAPMPRCARMAGHGVAGDGTQMVKRPQEEDPLVGGPPRPPSGSS